MNAFNVRVAFSRKNDTLGELIRDFTGGDVSHAFLMYDDPVFAQPITLGANSNGLTPLTLEGFRKIGEIAHIFAPRQINSATSGLVAGLRYYANLLSTPYDFTGLVGMAGVEIERKLGLQPENLLRNKHKLWCSEYVKMVLQYSGYAILPDVVPGETDPAQLCEALKASPEFIEVQL